MKLFRGGLIVRVCLAVLMSNLFITNLLAIDNEEQITEFEYQRDPFSFFDGRYYIEATGAAFCQDCPPTKQHILVAMNEDPAFQQLNRGKRYGTYTYVLAPLLAFDGAGEKKLNLVLNELDKISIKKTTPSDNNRLNRVANVILIPTTENAKYSDPLAYELTNAIWVGMGAAGDDIELIKGLPKVTQGPILVSMNKPHFELKEGDPVLWFDMSSAPVDSIKQLLSEYIMRIEDKPITSPEEFNTWATKFVIFSTKFTGALNETMVWVKKLKEAIDTNETTKK